MNAKKFLKGFICPKTLKLEFPFDDYFVTDEFGKRFVFDDGTFQMIQLTEKYNVLLGIAVMNIGRGKVLYTSRREVVVAHRHPGTEETFFSVYVNFGKIHVRKGNRVNETILGEVGRVPVSPMASSYRKPSRSYFSLGIYTGPIEQLLPENGQALPRYWEGSDDRRTRPEWWFPPREFIRNYHSDGEKLFEEGD